MKKSDRRTEILEPVRKHIQVDLPAEQAFALFADGISTWWPLETHSLGDVDTESCAIEGKVGGRIYEIMQDGTEADWGRVTEWDPPHKLVFTWHLNRDESTAQTVEVMFLSAGSGTEIELIHRDWELLGDRANEMRDGYDSGWDFVLGQYIDRSKM